MAAAVLSPEPPAGAEDAGEGVALDATGADALADLGLPGGTGTAQAGAADVPVPAR